MKTLYFDCSMGAAGDMLTAALLELLEDQEGFIEELNQLNMPGVHITKHKMTKCGLKGTHITVKVDEEEEGEDMHTPHHVVHSHNHDPSHDHDHIQTHTHKETHSHRGLHEIDEMIRNFKVSAKVKKDVLEVYRLIGEAESHVHGVPITEIHFHEVGTLDAIADITAVCLLIEKLAPEQILVSPIHVGSGQVKCAHGILPVPAPATAYILKDIPIYGGSIRSELCTPSGAALLKYFADSFGPMPIIKTQAIGYGMGKKDFEVANCVRVILGETSESSNLVAELCCNVDDMTGEEFGFAEERLLEAGALDVYTVSVGMKKSRPGVLLCVMCRLEDKDKLVKLIFRHTTTLGVRENISSRYTLSRVIKKIPTRFGVIRKKVSSGYGVVREKYEYEDISRIAKEREIGICDIKKIVIEENITF